MKRKLIIAVLFIFFILTIPSQAKEPPIKVTYNSSIEKIVIKAREKIMINKVRIGNSEIALESNEKYNENLKALVIDKNEETSILLKDCENFEYEINYSCSDKTYSLKGKFKSIPSLTIQNFSQELLATIHSGESFKVKIELRNQGSETLKDLRIEFPSKNKFTLLSENLIESTFELRPGQTFPLEYSLLSDQDLIGLQEMSLVSSYFINDIEVIEEIPFKINIVSKLIADKNINLDKNDSGMDSPNVNSSSDDSFLPPTDNSSSNHLSGTNDNTQATSNKPKLIVDNYSYTPNPLKAGENFKLTLSFFNTNSKKAIQNVRIVLNSTAPVTSQEGGENTNTSIAQDSVFTPIDSSNTFYIDSIPSKSRVTKTITLTSPRDINPQTYELNVALDYEDKSGNEYTATEIVGIPIVQEAKLDTGVVEIQELAELNMPMNVSVDYYNTGKSPLYNLMVKIEGDFNIEGQAEYLGNFQPGNSENFSAVITPTEPGRQKGFITFTYEDTTGQSHEIKQDFSFQVDESPVDTDMDEFVPEFEEKPFYKSTGFIFSLILLAIIALTIIFIKKKKNKSNEKDLDLND